MTTIDIAIVTAPVVCLEAVIDGCPERVSYLILFAALALAEAGGDPDIAYRALEENALRGGWNFAVAAFGSIHPGYEDIHFTPQELLTVVALARGFIAVKGADQGAPPTAP